MLTTNRRMWPGPLWAGGSQVLSGVSGEALACSPSRLAGLPGKGPTSCRVPAPLGPRPLLGAALPSLGPAPPHPSPAFLCGPSCCPQPPSRPPSGMFRKSRGRATLIPLPARSGSSRGSSGSLVREVSGRHGLQTPTCPTRLLSPKTSPRSPRAASCVSPLGTPAALLPSPCPAHCPALHSLRTPAPCIPAWPGCRAQPPRVPATPWPGPGATLPAPPATFLSIVARCSPRRAAGDTLQAAAVPPGLPVGHLPPARPPERRLRALTPANQPSPGVSPCLARSHAALRTEGGRGCPPVSSQRS